jgi:NADH-quinone oxidoreductase subunit E
MWTGKGEVGQAMLTDEERKAIEEEVGRCEQRTGASVEALRIVQGHRGFVSDDALKAVAEFLDMTPEELDGVATFYPFIFRKPVGRHVIFICDGVACWVMGFESVLGRITARLGIGLGETTEDGRFTLLPISCIGACDHAPALMIDGKLYRDLDMEMIDEILDQHL